MTSLPALLDGPRGRPTFRRPDQVGSLGLAVVTIAVVAFASLLVVVGTPFVRLPLAMAFGFALSMLALARPRAGIVATIVYLTALALMRRLLISTTGWWQVDPLLLVGPLVLAVLLVKLFVLDRRSLAPDLLSKLVLLLVAVSIVQVVNPAGGGPGKGLLGVLYVTVPLLWFFVGRELLDDHTTNRLMQVVVVLGIAVAGYGLVQSQFGHPPWDQAWVDQAGYDALNVGDVTRPFGTFSSSAEYALFIGAALVISVALALQGRVVALLALPVLAPALFLASARGALLKAILATVVVVALGRFSPRRAAAIILVAGGLAFAGFTLFGSSLTSLANSSGNSLVSHQVGGIGNPLDPKSSTLLLHITIALDGVKWSLHNPLGQGTASTNVGGAARDPGAEQVGSTEVDLTNSFVAFGPLGGLLYLGLVLLILVSAARAFYAGRWVMLPVIGLLMAGLTQWLIGRHYALSPLTWLLIGVVAASAASIRARAA